jgi:hypothetical protein
MIAQLVNNESIRFGKHIDIEVSYKILWLEVPKLVPILYYSSEQKHPLSLQAIFICTQILKV